MNNSVFVTGAQHGTGYAIAERFAKDGYNIFIGSRNGDAAQQAADKISKQYGVFAKGYETKIFDEENAKAIFDDIEKNGHLINVIVLNAANLGIGQSTLEVDMTEFMDVFNTNIGWNFMMARQAVNHMLKCKKGSIVFINSNSAHRVTENRVAYCSSKGAMLTMSKCLALDLGKYNIRSNCVLPGMIKTDRWETNKNGCREYLANYTPLGDIADFCDIAEAAFYFGSDASRLTTGAELVVDGGMLTQLTPNLENKPYWLRDGE